MYSAIKRLIDIIVSLFALIVLLPILLLTYVAIKLDSPGPAIFKQKRLGKDGKEFIMYKFRSMAVGAENTGSRQYSFEGDPRVTKVGKFIRKTSIDEFPQFINILKGDMSLIGFRPPLTYHPWSFEKYTEEQKKMFRIRPGITGWAQIHGRKSINWEDRIKLNIWYADHISFWLDFKIFFITILKIMRNDDNINTGATI